MKPITACFSAGALCALLVSTPAFAQIESGPPPDARLRLGALALEPKLALRNVGIDTNALNQSGSAEQDATATLTPELQAWLRVSRLQLSSVSSVDWNYFQRLTSQRSFNGAEQVRAELALVHLRPYIQGSAARSRQRPNLEIDARVEHTTIRAGAGVVLQLGPKLAIDLSRERRILEFGDTEVDAVRLAESLNRREEETSVSGRFALTPLTSVVVDARYRQDRFDRAAERDTDTTAVTGGLEFKPLALISGKARIGWRRFTPLGDRLPEFRGVISDVELSYLAADLLRVTATVTREIEYSFEPVEPYYVSTGTQLSLVQALGTVWDVVGRVGRTSLAYERLEGLPASVATASSRARVDRIVVVGGGLGRRLGSDIRVGVDVDRAARRSDAANRSYEGIRVGGSVTYGF